MSAPTTEQVRAWLTDEEGAAKFDRYASDGIQDRASASARTLREVALPLAERRDALATALATIALAAGLGADAAAEEVVKRVRELKWMVSAICIELFCNKELPVSDALTISRIDGITRKHDPGPFDEAVLAEKSEG